MFLKHFVLLILAVVLWANESRAEPSSPANVHGTLKDERVWSANTGDWVPIETFWLQYAKQSAEKFWGQRASYPPYREVSEHDTILIEKGEGICLMEFFHRRWRRAQDVRRWDSAFNDYSACPAVFK